ncbi:RagB/SusD family nutrient uptake outer membrane protein [Pedobacter sp.]
MKSYLYKIIVLALIFSFSSCSKDYLDTTPVDQMTEEEMFKNITNTKIALAGAYRVLYQQISNQEEDGHTSIMIAMDYMGEDVVLSRRGTDPFYGTYRFTDHLTEENALPLFAWRLYYRLISNVNIILEKIDSVPDATDLDKRTIKGECLALRAFGHHMLVQLYCKRYRSTDVEMANKSIGIPLLTSYSLLPQPRASIEEIYQQINIDLNDAINFLDGVIQPGLYRTHIDKSVAMGLKARVALTQLNYTEAHYWAKEAMKRYSLMSERDVLNGFTNMINDEWMWGLHILEDQVPSYGSFYGYMSSNFNSTHTRANPKLINKELYNTISATDVRKKLWCEDISDFANYPGVIHGTKYYSIPDQVRVPLMHNKFRVANPGSRAGDVPLMRAAEMYLIAAEAKAGLNLYQDAADELYPLAKARDPQYKIPDELTEMNNEVIKQRRIELWGEGFRFLDLKRRNENLRRTPATGVDITLGNIGTTLNLSASSASWQFVIPRREKNANPYIQ